MPGIARASKLDSSNTMTMCGGLETVQGLSAAAARLSLTFASDSSTPRVTRSPIAVTPERVNLEK